MAGFEREELEQFWKRWLEANDRAERERDWGPLADFYAPDATYGWMYSPNEHFMAVGREEIRDYALGTEMAGLDGWVYPYQAVVIDEQQGMVVGFWRQISDATDEHGEPCEVHGIGGSWFGYGGDGQWAWQRDWFDLNSAAETFLSIMSSGQARQGLIDRMHLDTPSQPGHYARADLPAPVWPVPTTGRP